MTTINAEIQIENYKLYNVKFHHLSAHILSWRDFVWGYDCVEDFTVAFTPLTANIWVRIDTMFSPLLLSSVFPQLQ